MRDKKSGFNDDGFWQRVNFEKIPSYCTNCHILGHNMATCKLLTENQKHKGRKVEEQKNKAESNEKANFAKEYNNKGKGSAQNEDKLQQMEKQSDNHERFKSVPYLTENWEIGNRRRGKAEATLRERKTFQGELSKVATKNAFLLLSQNEREGSDKNLEMGICFKDESLIQEAQRDSENLNPTQVCTTNREASVPGSSTFEVKGCVLPEFVKKQNGESCIPESGPPIAANELLAQSLAHVAAPKAGNHPAQSIADSEPNLGPTSPFPSIHLSDTLVQDTAHFALLRKNDSVAQCIPEPKAQKQEGLASSPKQSFSSDVVDNWVLSDRKMSGKRGLNKDAMAFSPSLGSHRSSSWIDDGEDWGPDSVCSEGNVSDGSAQFDFQRIEEEYEYDFTVYPPVRRNSTSDLPPCNSRKYSPPITRSRGLKIPKKKNKFRLG